MPEELYWLLFAMALPLVMIIVAGSLSILKNSRATLEPAEASQNRYWNQIAAARKYDSWAEELGLEPVGCYVMPSPGPAFIAAWRHRDRATCFCMYHIANRYIYDFVTIFSNGGSLTTGSSKDGNWAPAMPLCYKQTFSENDMNALWSLHLAGETYLKKEARIEVARPLEDFENLFIDYIHRQAAHIRSHFLWPLRMPYWYLIRRPRRHNRSIEDQHQAGMIVMPRDVIPPRASG